MGSKPTRVDYGNLASNIAQNFQLRRMGELGAAQLEQAARQNALLAETSQILAAQAQRQRTMEDHENWQKQLRHLVWSLSQVPGRVLQDSANSLPMKLLYLRGQAGALGRISADMLDGWEDKEHLVKARQQFGEAIQTIAGAMGKDEVGCERYHHQLLCGFHSLCDREAAFAVRAKAGELAAHIERRQSERDRHQESTCRRKQLIKRGDRVIMFGFAVITILFACMAAAVVGVIYFAGPSHSYPPNFWNIAVGLGVVGLCWAGAAGLFLPVGFLARYLLRRRAERVPGLREWHDTGAALQRDQAELDRFRHDNASAFNGEQHTHEEVCAELRAVEESCAAFYGEPMDVLLAQVQACPPAVEPPVISAGGAEPPVMAATAA
jgi:hypothetical protein